MMIYSYNFKKTDKPEAPGKPDVKDITKVTVTLNWTAPEKDGGNEIFNYVVEHRPIRSIKWLPGSQNILVPDCKFMVKGLTEGKEYEFRVAAENKAGIGQFSPPSDTVIVQEPISKWNQTPISFCTEKMLDRYTK